MPRKSIRLKIEVHARLLIQKRPGESISDVIQRLMDGEDSARGMQIRDPPKRRTT